MAAVINKRDSALQAASPRIVAVNLGSTVNVDGTISGSPASTVVSNATTAAAHAASTGNPHGATLTQISGDLDDIADGVTYFRTNANQVTGAGRAFNGLNSSSEYIKSLKSTQLTVVGSNPSTGWVGDVNGIRMYQSGSLKVNIPISGAPTFNGDITGDSNINITGNAVFQGNSLLGGADACVHVNQSLTATNGLIAYCDSGTGTAAVKGIATTTNSNGVIGQANVSGAVGLRGINSFAGGIGLSVTGAMTITSTTIVSNLNADMVDGKHASSLCQIVVGDTGTCTVSGNGFNINVTVAGTRARGTSNFIYIEPTSDESLKQNIEDETLDIDFINRLRPVQYRLKSDPKIKYHGFIAQDLEKIVSLSDGDALFQVHDDGIKGTDYMSLIAPLVKAVQQLSQELNHLKKGSNHKWLGREK